MELKASVEMGVLHTGKAVFKTLKNEGGMCGIEGICGDGRTSHREGCI